MQKSFSLKPSLYFHIAAIAALSTILYSAEEMGGDLNPTDQTSDYFEKKKYIFLSMPDQELSCSARLHTLQACQEELNDCFVQSRCLTHFGQSRCQTILGNPGV